MNLSIVILGSLVNNSFIFLSSNTSSNKHLLFLTTNIGLKNLPPSVQINISSVISLYEIDTVFSNLLCNLAYRNVSKNLFNSSLLTLQIHSPFKNTILVLFDTFGELIM